MARPFAEQPEFRKKLVQKILDSKDKVSVFAETFLGYKPYDYNKYYLDCKDKYVIYRCGRKVGKSFSTAAKVIHYAWFAPMMSDLIQDRCDILIVAPTQNQASIIMDMIWQLLTRSDLLQTYVVRKTATELEIAFINRTGISRIYTRAAGDTGTSVRGYVPHVIIVDEAAHVRRRVLVALLPAGMATNTSIWMTSTPFGKVGYFYESCLNARAGSPKLKAKMHREDGFWIQFNVSSLENPEVKKNPMMIEELQKLSKDEYKQEVLGEFPDVGNVLIPQELILQAMGSYKLPQHVRYSIGVDVARSGKDETVFCVVAVDDNDKVFLVETHSMESSTMVDVVNKLGEFVTKYQRSLDVIFMDETGLGGGAVDLALSYEYPVRGVTFSLQEKNDMYSTLVTLFENGRIKIGDNTKMSYQLSYLEKTYTANNNLRIVTDQHDDYPDALALACKVVFTGDAWAVLDGSVDDIF